MTTGLTERALRYRQIATTASDAADWEILAALVATDRFVQVDRNKRVCDWPETLAALRHSPIELAGEIGRVDEAGALVFVETNDAAIESLTVFEFDEAGLLCRLDLFR